MRARESGTRRRLTAPHKKLGCVDPLAELAPAEAQVLAPACALMKQANQGRCVIQMSVVVSRTEMRPLFSALRISA